MATVLTFWEQQVAIYDAAQKAAQADLTKAQARLAAAREKLEGVPSKADGDLKTLAKTTTEIAAKRGALAAANPPDATAILAEIVALLIKQRGLQGVVMDDRDEIDAARAAVDGATAGLGRARDRVATAKANVDAAKADDATRKRMKDALGIAPLKTIKADATALLGATATKAKSQIDKNFPAEIQTIAGKRRATRVGRLASLEADVDLAGDALGSGQAADAGLAGKALQKRLAFERAQDALAAYVDTAVERIAQAKATLKDLEQKELAGGSLLTAQERARLADLKTAGAAAEPDAENLDKDLNDLFKAESDLAAQMLTSIAADVDKLAVDVDIPKKRQAIADARKKFSDDLTAFAKKPDLDAWQAAIPDEGWIVLLRYQDALATLDELKALTPATLATAMDTAEDDYAKALALAEISARRADCIGDEVELRQTLLTAARGAITGRLPSAVRGDNY